MYTCPNVPRCHYIKTNGTRCGSPALRDQKFCYFHQRWQQQRINLRHFPGEDNFVELPVLEDANSIQMSLTQVMRLVLSLKISHKEAGLLLYALQIASANLRRTSFELHDEKQVVIDPAMLTKAGVGVDSWKTADFPNPLPADPAPDAASAFTPDPAQPVYVTDKKVERPPQPAVIPELKAQADQVPAARLLARSAKRAASVWGPRAAEQTSDLPRSSQRSGNSAPGNCPIQPVSPYEARLAAAALLNPTQGSVSIREVAGIQHLYARLMVSVERRNCTGAPGCDGIGGISKPHPEMAGLDGHRAGIQDKSLRAEDTRHVGNTSAVLVCGQVRLVPGRDKRRIRGGDYKDRELRVSREVEHFSMEVLNRSQVADRHPSPSCGLEAGCGPGRLNQVEDGAIAFCGLCARRHSHRGDRQGKDNAC
jgi:hypothetical protein